MPTETSIKYPEPSSRHLEWIVQQRKKIAEAKAIAPADKQLFIPEVFREAIIAADPVYERILDEYPESMINFEYEYYLSGTLSNTKTISEFVFRYLGDVERT